MNSKQQKSFFKCFPFYTTREIRNDIGVIKFCRNLKNGTTSFLTLCNKAFCCERPKFILICSLVPRFGFQGYEHFLCVRAYTACSHDLFTCPLPPFPQLWRKGYSLCQQCKAVLPNLVILTAWAWVDGQWATYTSLFDHKTSFVYILTLKTLQVLSNLNSNLNLGLTSVRVMSNFWRHVVQRILKRTKLLATHLN